MRRFAGEAFWWVLIVVFLAALLVVHAHAGGSFFDKTTVIGIPAVIVLAIVAHVVRTRRMRND